MRVINSMWILLIIGLISCKQNSTEKVTEDIKEPKIVSANNEMAYNEIKKLNLDSTYTNLLDPRNVSEPEYKMVMKSWSEFHKNISQFLIDENFKWEVPDSTITIFNRIYFDKNGTIDYFTFKIKTPSVSDEKQTEYEKILLKFSKQVKLNLKRPEQYAQCGKTKYLNY
ncbi:MAG TPA: hypothetical protein VKY41_01115 [Xanthomarina sp.]|nr:hypothetical protein [Xanthomarina sp.]